MERAKITLSRKEMELVRDAGFILTKLAVIDKVYAMFGNIVHRWQQRYADAPGLSPKIARGESYQQLPYVMLDLIRVFTPGLCLSIRVFFWWGNYFSCTLHSKGTVSTDEPEEIARTLGESHFPIFVSTTGDEWNHDLHSEDYREVRSAEELVMALMTTTSTHLKLVKKVDLNDWESAEEKLAEAVSQWMTIVTRHSVYAPMR
jgi:hypothetical protein